MYFLGAEKGAEAMNSEPNGDELLKRLKRSETVGHMGRIWSLTQSPNFGTEDLSNFDQRNCESTRNARLVHSGIFRALRIRMFP